LDVKVGKGSYRVCVPSFRPDLTREIDLIEEVARGYGYQRFKGKFTTRGSYSGTLLPGERIENDLRALLTGFGFVEILTPSITREAALVGPLLHEKWVPLRNPLSEDMAVLRPSLLPGIMEVVARNFSFGARALRIFEIGKTFCLDHNGRANERVALGFALAGDARPPQFGDSVRTVDLFDLKGVLEAILKRFSLRQAVMASDNALSFLDNGGCLSLGGVRLGCLGKVKGSVAEYFNIRKEVYFSEIEIEPLNQASTRAHVVASISRFPSVERDISIVVSEDVPWAAIERSVRAVGGELLEELNLFDVFRHERIGLNRKALGISLRFRAANRTLSAEEVEEKQAACLTHLSEAFGATLRG
jgi:phenylalanyl-tRNA synthetase beta chain